MGDIEIQIRRSIKATENQEKKDSSISASIKPSAITHEGNGLEKNNTKEEKPANSGNYWDYSVSHGKIFSTSSLQ